jgi:hypothetical protein
MTGSFPSNSSWSARLYLPTGEGNTGFLELKYGDGPAESEWPVIKLVPALVSVLWALWEARRLDAAERRPRQVRGWRTREQLSKMIALRTEYQVGLRVITANVGAIKRAVRDNVEPFLQDLAAPPPAPLLFEHARKGGTRLAIEDFEVVVEARVAS